MNPKPTLTRIEGEWDVIGPFDANRLTYEGGRLRVLLDGPSGTVAVTVEDVYGFRMYDEGDLLNLWELYGGVPRYGLYECSNGEHARWALGMTIHDQLPALVRNFMIVSANEVVDILAASPPL